MLDAGLPTFNVSMIARYEYLRNLILPPLPSEHLRSRIYLWTCYARILKRFRFPQDPRHKARYCIYQRYRRKFTAGQNIGANRDFSRLENLLYPCVNTLVATTNEYNVFLTSYLFCHLFVELHAVGCKEYLYCPLLPPQSFFNGFQNRRWLQYHAWSTAIWSLVHSLMLRDCEVFRVIK